METIVAGVLGVILVIIIMNTIKQESAFMLDWMNHDKKNYQSYDFITAIKNEIQAAKAVEISEDGNCLSIWQSMDDTAPSILYEVREGYLYNTDGWGTRKLFKIADYQFMVEAAEIGLVRVSFTLPETTGAFIELCCYVRASSEGEAEDEALQETEG